MLKDIEKLTRFVCDQFIPKNEPIDSGLHLYRAYMALKEVIEHINLVSEHYLALDFTKEYLQNSSHGKPSDKWRYVLNEDLNTLNDSVKNYLQLLNTIAPQNINGLLRSYLSEKYKSLAYYGVVRDEYSVGYIDAAGFTLRMTQLNTKATTSDSIYITQDTSIDLSTYEQRLELQELLRTRKQTLQIYLEEIKQYIIKNYTLEDLL